MSIELYRDRPSFDKSLMIQIIHGGEEVRCVNLVFRIIPGTRSESSGHCDNLIHFEISSESDPYFLYTLNVSEPDYPYLKNQQRLMFEFSDLASKMIELIKLCFREPSSMYDLRSSTTTFNSSDTSATSTDVRISSIAKLDTSNGLFSIVRVDSFRQMDLIQLQLRPGTDADIKAYLASRLQHTITELNKISRDLSSTTENLSNETFLRERIEKEHLELRSRRDFDMQAAELNYKNEISSLRVSLGQQLEESRQSHEEQIEALRQELGSLRKSSSDKISHLEIQLATMTSEKTSLESRLEEKTRQFNNTQEEHSRILQELSEEKTQRRAIDDSRRSGDLALARAQAKVESLLQQLQDKDEMIEKSVALQRAAENQTASVEEKLQICMVNLQKLEEKYQEGAEVLKKGNEDIKKLMQRKDQLEKKNNLRIDVMRKQEAQVKELQEKLSQERQTILNLEHKQNTLLRDMEFLRRENEDKDSRLKASAELITNNQYVINSLNEELNKNALPNMIDNNMFNTISPSPVSITAMNSSSFGYLKRTDDLLREDYETHARGLGTDSQSMSPSAIAGIPPSSYFPSPPPSTSRVSHVSRDDYQYQARERGVKLSSNRNTSDDSSGRVKEEAEIHRLGLRNLGLLEQFDEIDTRRPQTRIDIYGNSSSAHFSSASPLDKRAGISTARAESRISPPKNTASNTNSTQSKRGNYSWQAEDYGLA